MKALIKIGLAGLTALTALPALAFEADSLVGSYQGRNMTGALPCTVHIETRTSGAQGEKTMSVTIDLNGHVVSFPEFPASELEKSVASERFGSFSVQGPSQYNRFGSGYSWSLSGGLHENETLHYIRIDYTESNGIFVTGRDGGECKVN